MCAVINFQSFCWKILKIPLVKFPEIFDNRYTTPETILNFLLASSTREMHQTTPVVYILFWPLKPRDEFQEEAFLME